MEIIRVRVALVKAFNPLGLVHHCGNVLNVDIAAYHIGIYHIIKGFHRTCETNPVHFFYSHFLTTKHFRRPSGPRSFSIPLFSNHIFHDFLWSNLVPYAFNDRAYVFQLQFFLV